MGADDSGHLVLLNLPHAGVVLLDGQQEQVKEVLISLALEWALARGPRMWKWWSASAKG